MADGSFDIVSVKWTSKEADNAPEPGRLRGLAAFRFQEHGNDNRMEGRSRCGDHLLDRRAGVGCSRCSQGQDRQAGHQSQGFRSR